MTLQDVDVSLIDCDHRTPPSTASGYPYVMIPQIREGRLDLSGVRQIKEEHYIEWTRKARPQEHDVVLSRRCNPGETAVVPPNLKFAVGQNLVLLRANGSKLIPQFLRWIVRGPEWWDQIRTYLNSGAVFDSLKCADVPKFQLTIPPVPVQHAIARILGTLDDKIELNRRMNHTLESLARAIFQSWFVDFDPVTAKAAGRKPVGMGEETARLFPDSFEESSMRLIPKGWTVASLSMIADVIMGTSPSGDTYNDTGAGVPLINGPVEYGDFFPVKKKWTTSPTRLCKANDLIFCVRGSTTGRRVVADDIYCLGRGVCAIRAHGNAQGFVDLAIDTGLDGLLSAVTGSTFPNLNGPEIKQFKLVKPSADILNNFCQLIEPIRTRIRENVKLIHTLAALLDSLLPQLLSGELRIKDAEKMVEKS